MLLLPTLYLGRRSLAPCEGAGSDRFLTSFFPELPPSTYFIPGVSRWPLSRSGGSLTILYIIQQYVPQTLTKIHEGLYARGLLESSLVPSSWDLSSNGDTPRLTDKSGDFFWKNFQTWVRQKGVPMKKIHRQE